MNTQHIIAAAAIAFVGTGAFAVEATQFTDTPSTLSREVVKAELARDQAASKILGREVHYAGDAAVFTIPAGNTAARAEAASRVLGRTVTFNEATTFVDETPAADRAVSVLARMFK